LATATQEVPEVVAEISTMAAIKIKEDIILVVISVVEVVGIDVEDNTMPVEVVTLVGDTDQPRCAFKI